MVSDKVEEKLGFYTIRRRLSEHLVSAMGKEELSAMHPTPNSGARSRFLTYTAVLQSKLAQGDVLPLQDWIDIRPYLEQIRPAGAVLNGEFLDEIRKVCRASRRIRLFFSKQGYDTIYGLVRPIKVLQELEIRIEDTVDSNGTVRESASTELGQIRGKLRQRQQALREKLHALLSQAIQKGYAAEPQLTMRAGRLVLPLHAEAKRKLRGFVHDTSATGQTVFFEPAACLDLGNEVRILEVQEQREIERLLRELTQQVRTHAESIAHNLSILGTIDLLHAKAQLSLKLEGVIPRLSDKPILNIREGKNPALSLTIGQRKVVPLTVSIGEHARTLVITGPNAGGKTVTMKTCGLMLLMLGCGIPVPAHPDSEFGTFNHILVEIGDEQSIEQDLSTFSARIAGLRKMCEVAEEGALLLVDEIGTGTDPAEGAALAQAVLEHFTDSGAVTIVTTHHGTLKAYAHESEGVTNGSMDFDEQSLQPTFFFRQGLPGSSYAFRIASRMNFNPDILSRARQILGTPGATLESLISSYREQISKLEAAQIPLTDENHENHRSASTKSDQKVRREQGKASPVPVTNLKKGQQVVIDGGTTSCEILSIEGRYAMVSAGNVRMKVALKRLNPVRKKKLRPKTKVEQSAAQIRIDVRGLRVQEALSEVERLLDRGIGANLISVEILHGTGTGALRSAIHEYLTSSEVKHTAQCLDSNPGLTVVKLDPGTSS